MSAVPTAVLFNGTRRVRTLFTGPLASGAFTSLTMYSITADDGATNPIHVVAVFAIANNANAVEIAVDSDLVSGALYTIGYTAVPAADTTTFTGTIDSRVGLDLGVPANIEPETDDLALLLYGRDHAWNNDLVEDPTGDLLTISGRPNWKGAMGRRFSSTGLKWDPSYGPNLDESVDAPSPYAPGIAGSLVAQARLDDRTSQAVASVQPATNDPDGFVLAVKISGKDGLDPIELTQPVP